MGTVEKFQGGGSEGLMPGEVNGRWDLTRCFIRKVRQAKWYSATGRNCDRLSREEGLVTDVAHGVLKTLRNDKGLRENVHIPLCIVMVATSKATLCTGLGF